MPGSAVLSQITSTTVDGIVHHHLPVLVACIRKDETFHEHKIMLKYVADFYHGQMHVLYALEDMFPYFRDTFSIYGTPTYLIIHKGEVIRSIMGITAYYNLIEQVNSILSDEVYSQKAPEERRVLSADGIQRNGKKMKQAQAPRRTMQRRQGVK